MSSLAPSTTTTGKLFSSSSTYASSFSFKSSQIPTSRNNKNLHAVSCKTLDNHDHNENSGKLDRRNLMLGLGGLYGVGPVFGSGSFAFVDPILAPDITKCGAADLPVGVKTNCCPPLPKKIIDFKSLPTSTIRVRPAAHSDKLVNSDYIAKFNKAIELMKALPDDDPRSFKQQAAVHCAYCDGAYHQVGFPDLELQVHFSWLFLPFHRLYLYFFEKICGQLINDPTFAIPFWNWDAPDGMKIPDIYTNKKSPLYDCFRDAYHQPPSIVDLDFNGKDKNISREKQISRNLATMHRQIVSGTTRKMIFSKEII